MTHTTFTLEVQPRIPARLRRLEELAGDLVYSRTSTCAGASTNGTEAPEERRRR
jgi:hypothetical protein